MKGNQVYTVDSRYNESLEPRFHVFRLGHPKTSNIFVDQSLLCTYQGFHDKKVENPCSKTKCIYHLLFYI